MSSYLPGNPIFYYILQLNIGNTRDAKGLYIIEVSSMQFFRLKLF
ncbi:MAG: hypothetical protein QXE66_01820 [Desulfurococcaceae archaeon]